MSAPSLAFRVSRFVLNLEADSATPPEALAVAWAERALREHTRVLQRERGASTASVWVYATIAGHFGRLALQEP